MDQELKNQYPLTSSRHKRNFLVQRYRHQKPICRPSFLETFQDSREWLISSKHRHGVLISSKLSPSQKECEANPSRAQKNAAVFAKRIGWRKITTTSLTEVTTVSTTNVSHKRKKSSLWML